MLNNLVRLTAVVCGICLGAAAVRAQPAQSGPKLPPTAADFAYGGHERQVLDFYQAESSSPAPLALYIHGGGFMGGDKKSVNQETLKQLLNAGVSVAAINYRLAGQAPLPAAHHDAQRALQTLRSKSKEWNIDKSQVGAFGGDCSVARRELPVYRVCFEDGVDGNDGAVLFCEAGGRVCLRASWRAE